MSFNKPNLARGRSNLNPALEATFFELFDPYIDLERNTGRKYTGSEYTLQGIKRLADLTGHPEQDLRIVHIAGTKGKGSTAIFLSSLLRSAGLSSGAFTSPHLVTVRERFLLNGIPVPYEQLLSEARELISLVRVHHLEPTFFELMTILALQLFRRQQCGIVILEAGIGGRLDCTNYVETPACTVLTSISLDHTALLGNTILRIAREKAGIIKPGVPVVCASQPYPEAVEVIHATAEKCRSRFIQVTDATDHLQPWRMSDAAAFQKENFNTALTVCEVLGIKPSARNFEELWPRGRCEKIADEPLVVIDAAHNADSARRLCEAIQTRWPDVRFTVVLGIAKGKDSDGILRQLQSLSDDFVLTNPRPFKESDLENLTALAAMQELNYQVRDTIHSRGDLPSRSAYLFTGSFFTALIGEELFGASLCQPRRSGLPPIV